MVGDGEAEYVTGEIAQGGFAASYGLAVYDPLLGPELRVDLIKEAGRFQGSPEFAPDDACKGLCMNEQIPA